MPPIIQLDAVSKVYPGGFTAVGGIDLSIDAGEFVTLLGPSGCGKTTTLRMIAGFEAPSRGRVFLDGNDITDAPPYRRPVNTVFQDYALFPHLTVFDNVAYGLRVRKRKLGQVEILERVKDALRMVGLLNRAEHRPGQLSGGQRQRVAMARALACQPKVLLLDEPLSALDVKLRETMQVELKQLHDKLGITFLMVTHDQREALVMSDRIIVMGEGKIAQAGSPEDLYDRPASAYVADFIGASNLLRGRLIRMLDGVAEIDLGGTSLRGRVSPHEQPLKPGDPAVISIRPERMRQASGTNPAAFPLRVTDHHFHGFDLRIEGVVGSLMQRVSIDVRRDSLATSDTLPPIGTTAHFEIAPDDAIVFAGSLT